MTKFKNNPADEHDLQGDFIPTGLTACLDYYKNFDDCDYLENAIYETDTKISKALDELQYLIDYARVGHNDFLANKLINLKNNLK